MTVTLLLVCIMAASGIGLWRLLRNQPPHPTEPRQTIDFDELRAMWPEDGGPE